MDVFINPYVAGQAPPEVGLLRDPHLFNSSSTFLLLEQNLLYNIIRA